MNSKLQRPLIVLLLIISVTSAGLAYRFYTRLSTLNTDKGDADRAELQRRLWDSEKRRRDLEAQLAGMRGGAAAPEIAAPDAGPDDRGRDLNRPPGGGPNRGNFGANMLALMENPEFVKAVNAQQKAALDSKYASLFKSMNLSPAELDKFKNLLVEKQMSAADVMSAARAQGLNMRDPAARDQINKMVQTAQADADNNIMQAIGSDKFQQYKNYEQTLPQRNEVNQIAQRLSYSGTPLQDYQTDQLIQALAQTGKTSGTNRALNNAAAGGIGALMGAVDNTHSTITDATIQQAQSFLVPAQVDALKQLQIDQAAQQKVADMMRNQGRNNGTASNTTPVATVPTSPAGSTPKPRG